MNTPDKPPIPPHEKILVTADEAAAMLSMCKSTLWAQVKNKGVPAPIKVGTSTRWRVADLMQIGQGQGQQV